MKNESFFENKISQKYLFAKLINLNTTNEKFILNNKYTLSIKYIIKQKNKQIKERNINLNIKKNFSTNYTTNSKTMKNHNFLIINIIKYIFINILLYQFCIINSLNNFPRNKIRKIIKYHSHEITLKVKGIGIKNILSDSSSFIYPCPSHIYLNERLVQDITDCHHMEIKESYSKIKLMWNNKFDSTKGMFYNCVDITEIDMIQFDTSSVTDMSYMFALCQSLKFLKVDNLNTEKVETFENMFYNCKGLTSLNLESFRNPSATTIYRMFYGCENLEYINIKNFDEKDNMNIDEMFDNIPPNAVICFLSCLPPKNFIIDSMNTAKVTISWEENEYNKFIISYGLQNLSNPNDGDKINITDRTSYTFTNLNSNQKYNIYIKTDCESKSSYWLGPLLISFESYNMAGTGTNSIITCSKVIYDSGGPNGNYNNYENSILVVLSDVPGKLVSIKGTIDIELNPLSCDHLYIYDGEGTSGTLIGDYNGNRNIPLIISKTGPLTIKFTSDALTFYSGFELLISCNINTPQKSIYNLIKDNNCRMISCDNNWRNIQNLFVLDTISCENNDEFNMNLGEDYNCYPRPDNINFDNDKNYKCLNNNRCPDNYKYIIEEKHQCVYNCKQYPGFPYEFQKKCYNSCPENISEISEEKEYYCEIKCPKDLPYEIIKIQQCVSNCTFHQISNKLCKLNFKSNNNSEENEAQEKMIEAIRNEIINALDSSGIDEGEDMVIQEKDITITITNNNNQKNQITLNSYKKFGD